MLRMYTPNRPIYIECTRDPEQTNRPVECAILAAFAKTKININVHSRKSSSFVLITFSCSRMNPESYNQVHTSWVNRRLCY